MMTLDLTNTPISQYPAKVFGALNSALNTRQPFIPSRDYIETIAAELDWPSDLIHAAHQHGHLHLSGNPSMDVLVVKEFMRRYEHQSKD